MTVDECKYLMDELQRLQSNITSLFESVIIEKHKSNEEKEKAVACAQSLLTEIANLKKENEQLRKCNGFSRSPCRMCSELKEKLAIQDKKSKRLERNLSMIRKFLNEVPFKYLTLDSFAKLLIMQLDSVKDGVDEDTEQLHNTSGYGTGVEENTQSEEEIIYNTCTEHCLKNTLQQSGDSKSNNKYSSGIKTEKEVPNCHTESSKYETNGESQTPKKADGCEPDFIDSPLAAGTTTKTAVKSPILFGDKRGGSNRASVPTSPIHVKRKALEDISSPGKGKKIFIKSPVRKYKSPAKGSKQKYLPLKTTNSIEAETSHLGVRNLKQTQLNLFYYRKDDENGPNTSQSDTIHSEVSKKLECNSDRNKFEDDLILGSPQNFERVFDELDKGRRKANEDDREVNSKSDIMQEYDPDETFVSSMVISNTVKQESNEKHSGIEMSSKERQRSPEYNSVPYAYKASPVRKRADRQKLPGQVCMECEQYYKGVLGEIDDKKMQEILNRCSRHRDKHYNIVDTPPGYWKPYLTLDSSTCRQDSDSFSDD